MNHYKSHIHNRCSIRLKRHDYTQAGLYFITICCDNRANLFGEIADGKMVFNDAGIIADACWLEIPQHFPNVILHEYVIMPNHVHGIVEFVGAKNFSPHTKQQSPHTHHHSPHTKQQSRHPHQYIPNANNHSPNRHFHLPQTIDPELNETIGAEMVEITGAKTVEITGAKTVEITGAKTVELTGAKNFSPLRSPSKTIGSVVRGYKIGVTKWMRQNTDVYDVWQRNYYEHIIRNEQSYQTISNYIINNPSKWQNRYN